MLGLIVLIMCAEPNVATVKSMAAWSWAAYMKEGPARDEVGIPNTLHMAATAVDSLDTFIALDMHTEAAEAINIISKTDYTPNKYVSVFETTIRVFGGLLGAYKLSGLELLLRKATTLHNALAAAFKGRLLPCRMINLHTGSCSSDSDTTIADSGIALEYEVYARAVNTSNVALKSFEFLAQKRLRREHISVDGTRPWGDVSVDGGSDSYYEYLYKLGTLVPKFRDIYEEEMDLMLAKYGRHWPGGYFVGRDRGTHLSCFLPGVLARTNRIKKAEAMMDTCLKLCNTPTGLAAEAFTVRNGFKITDHKNGLRPEIIESVVYLLRATGNETYRGVAATMLKAYAKSRTEKGYAQVDTRTGQVVGGMPSFWLAETLKYFAMAFNDTLLAGRLLNTEAHVMT